MIQLSKVIHRSKDCIRIQFPFSVLTIQELKKHPSIRYSATLKSWYIPYTKQDFLAFQKLNLPYSIIPSTCTGSLKPTGDSSGISFDNNEHSVDSDSLSNSQREADIVQRDDIIIEYSHPYLVVQLTYDKKSVDFLKTLHRSYWHKTSKRWLVKASISNLESLQSYFKAIPLEVYQRMYDLIRISNESKLVDIYYSPEFRDSFFVQLKGYQVDVDFIMSLSKRQYFKSRQSWLLPYSAELMRRLIAHYTEKGYQVTNRYKIKEVAPSKNGNSKQLDALLYKLRQDEKDLLTEIAQTMIRCKYSWRSIRSYTGKILRFYQFNKRMEMSKVTSDHVNAYLNHLSMQDASESLLNMTISALKFYFKQVKYVDGFEMDRVVRPRRGRALPRFLSKNEVHLILKSGRNLKHQTLMCTLYSTGIRLSELLAIRLEHIYWDRNQILVVSGKGKKDRMVTLSKVLKELLQFYFEAYKPATYLFESTQLGVPYSASSVQKVVRLSAKRAGITRKVTPHILRHSYATHLLDGGVDVRFIQELLGHKDIKTTLVYTHVSTRSIGKIESPLDQMWSRKES
jgi:integrase/recombinase XerD